MTHEKTSIQWHPNQENLRACISLETRSFLFSYPEPFILSHPIMPNNVVITQIHNAWLEEIPGCYDVIWKNMGYKDIIKIDNNELTNDQIIDLIATIAARYWYA